MKLLYMRRALTSFLLCHTVVTAMEATMDLAHDNTPEVSSSQEKSHPIFCFASHFNRVVEPSVMHPSKFQWGGKKRTRKHTLC